MSFNERDLLRKSGYRIRLKSSGEIRYANYRNEIIVGEFHQLNGYKIPVYKRVWYDLDDKGITYEWEDIEIVPYTPYELFGLEVREEWKEAVRPIVDYVADFNDSNPDHEPMEIVQIKEKFGCLCVHLNFKTNELEELIGIIRKKVENRND